MDVAPRLRRCMLILVVNAGSSSLKLALLDDRDLARELGLQARATALQRHDPETVTQRMLETYGAVAGGGGA